MLIFSDLRIWISLRQSASLLSMVLTPTCPRPSAIQIESYPILESRTWRMATKALVMFQGITAIHQIAKLTSAHTRKLLPSVWPRKCRTPSTAFQHLSAATTNGSRTTGRIRSAIIEASNHQTITLTANTRGSRMTRRLQPSRMSSTQG